MTFMYKWLKRTVLTHLGIQDVFVQRHDIIGREDQVQVFEGLREPEGLLRVVLAPCERNRRPILLEFSACLCPEPVLGNDRVPNETSTEKGAGQIRPEYRGEKTGLLSHLYIKVMI